MAFHFPLKIKITRRQAASYALSVILLSLNFVMGHYVKKEMAASDLRKTQDEKLTLAYHLGGRSGLDYEFGVLNKYQTASQPFLKERAAELVGQSDPEGFLRQAMKTDRERVQRLRKRQLRISAAIYIFVTLQMLFNIRCWWKDNRHRFRKAVPAS
jgi:hypothetical protein